MNSFRHLDCRAAVPVLVFVAAIVCPAFWELGPAADEVKMPTREYSACLDCHEDQGTNLISTPHQMPLQPGADPRVTCTDCHVGDSQHYEDDPESYPMSNPSKLDPAGQAVVCSSCHQNSHQQNMREDNIHAVNDINCSGCHQVHGSKQQGLLKSAEVDLCISCHAGVEGQFAQPFRHPVNDGIVKCSECHMALDLTRRELSLNGTNVCFECHSEFRGPFPYEHQATVDYSTQEGGCLTCHEAHGSSNARMLKQPYAPPHFQLCSQCHSVPGHNMNSFHGTTWSGVACNECHSDVHGSYVSRNFLTESLQGQGCFNAGCHQY